MGEAGEVVCLEACLGGCGEGKGLNVAPRCGRRAREVYHESRARQEGAERSIEVYRMGSARRGRTGDMAKVVEVKKWDSRGEVQVVYLMS